MAASDHLIAEKAQALLDALLAIYAARTEDPPERQYVTTGPVALDCCDTLAVSVGRIFLGLPAQPSDGRISRNALDGATTAELTVVVARRIPVIDNAQNPAPPVEDLITSAEVTATDAWLVIDGVREAVRDEVFEPCTDVALGDCIPLDNSGGFGGYQMAVRVQL